MTTPTNNWIKDRKAPDSEGQKRTIRIMLSGRKLTEMWLHKGINKWINELNMGEADQVIKKISLIKIKKQNGK